MSTDTLTLPRRALEQDRPTPVSPVTPNEPSAVPTPAQHRPNRAATLLHLFLQTRHPASDPVLLVGPTGGPIWAFRAH